MTYRSLCRRPRGHGLSPCPHLSLHHEQRSGQEAKALEAGAGGGETTGVPHPLPTLSTYCPPWPHAGGLVLLPRAARGLTLPCTAFSTAQTRHTCGQEAGEGG